MCWKYVFIILLYVCTVESGYGDDDCIYKYICDDQQTKYERDIQGKYLLCRLDDIPNNEFILTNEGNSSTLTTILNLPNAQCTYDVALVVNSTVKSPEECKQHKFNDDSSGYQEVYTDYRICVVDEQSQTENQSNATTCKNDSIVLNHEHIFTGCYALRFSIDDGYKYIYQGRKYIVTNDEFTTVQEPTHQCTYFNRDDVNDSSHAVMFSLDISLHSASPTLHLGLRTFTSDHESENNACTNYGRDYLGDEWAINMNSSAPRTQFTRNCSFMTVHDNLTSNASYAESIDCRFSVGAPSNMSYCFKLKVIDERCKKNSLWNVPRRSYPCTWMLECNRDPKTREPPDHIGRVRGPIIAESSLLLPVGIALILFVIVIAGILISIHRWRANTQQAYLNANMRDLRVASSNEADAIDTDDEMRKLEKAGDTDEMKGIVLLYARGSTSFMALMTEFRDILQLYCKCHVFDWYAAGEWNDVAKVGACDWATNLFKNHHRAVWIDTPGARSLACNRLTDDKCSGDAISDFRDMAFFAVLDYAKRSVLNTKLQYSRHFIVRLEGFDNGTSAEDPFSDLSPHARYLIPYHLSQLCSHLSSRKSNSRGQALMTEEAQLRERLIQLKNES